MANRVKVRSDRQRVQPSKTLGSTRRGPERPALVRAALSVPLDDRPLARMDERQTILDLLREAREPGGTRVGTRATMLR